ncbi:manganese efflux pump MntP [Salirhabdus euzebyi]|uniref:manganese efflux pump MntP n=1 Tax=Salirhabdus euzebyi TaxID=394506 RepID=UPI00157A3177|nr:manganese efflux pump MntP family protein [Salirhabdus euzebyi]
MSYILGEWFTLSLMAIALGMDAFSVSLGMGMIGLRLRRIAMIGLLIGLFHVIMPFIGMLLGNILSKQFGSFAVLMGGILLIVLGIQMFINSFSKEEDTSLVRGFGLLIFAFTVSLDSFSVGLSLGMSGVHTIVALFLFGLASTILTWLGFLLAKKVSGILGSYSELIGGSILCAFGLQLIL